MDINITINAGEEPKVKIDKPKSPMFKRKTRKLKNGKETIIELPNTVETTDNRNILNMMGI